VKEVEVRRGEGKEGEREGGGRRRKEGRRRIEEGGAAN
jgi:hypothetical protein